MSGRIKIMDDQLYALNSQGDTPAIAYQYDAPTTFDKACGTFGIDKFQLPNPYCPSAFVCRGDTSSSSTTTATYDQELYIDCYDAINCQMMAEMTTGFKSADPVALFIHQMIPHHQNAVSMAKNLLRLNTVVCDDLSNEDDQDCILESVLRGIINTQNHQIQQMRSYLTAYELPPNDNCNVYVETIDITSSNSISGRSTLLSSSAASLLTLNNNNN
jgi:Domain of unknown function (DUF305)